MRQLEDKVVIISGASSGIGLATAKLFASEGAKLVVTARRKDKLNELVSYIRAIGGEVVAVPGDVSDESHAKRLVDTALKEYGALDVAFNNAGILGAGGPTSEVSLDGWARTINTNLTSAFLNAKYQYPAMKKSGSGSIIYTSSFVGYTVGLPQMAAYSASKAGLVGLTKALASEFAGDGVRVNALLPGGTNTPMGQEAANTPEALEYVKNIHALKRLASPEEIAKSALYLASDASSFTTGTAMLVDGGASISKTF